MRFTKMNGAGNDFIIINNIEEKIPVEKLGGLAKKLCHRRMSLGADGLMAVDSPEEGGDFKMRFYNADGSLGEMCGNGARCIARYGYEKGLAGEVQHIETTAGMVTGRRLSERQYKIRLNDVSVMKLGLELDFAEGKTECAYTELGNPGLPHAVVECKGLSGLLCGSEKAEDFERFEELRSLAKKIRHYQGFPKGANVNFYEITGADKLCELTYERGVEDFTLACGTGTGAVVSVLAKLDRVSGRNVRVQVLGGELFIDINSENGGTAELYLTGDTKLVAEGIILDEDLQKK